MNTKEEIKQFAMEVGHCLSIYISVHDRIINEGGTLKSLFKKLIGRATPMSAMLAEAENLVPAWDAIAQRIESFRLSHSYALPADERKYLEILSRYVVAVQRTIVALVERQRLLNQGSLGGGNNPITNARSVNTRQLAKI
jgi:hypothetical protein